VTGDLPAVLALGALLIGLVFGYVAQRSSFCTVAALSNWVLLRDYRQAHAYFAALGLAMLGTGLLEWGGLAAIADSSYRSPRFDLIGLLLGGLLFGFGSMIAGGCVTRTLIRTAEGNLGSLATLLVLTFVAMAVLFGVLEPVRGWVIEQSALHLGDGRSGLAGWLSLPPVLVAIAGAALCALVVLRAGDWHDHPGMVVAGGVIGLTIVAAWWLTGYLADDELEATVPVSISVVGPLARTTTWILLGRVTGSQFGLFLIAGIFFGALLSALLSGSFRLVRPDGARFGLYLAGGGLMGAGAIMAGGCNVGQGLTGLATLSLQSVTATAAILLGMRIGLWWLERE
jgi:uncharacterized membrane protein YedE/YeeE